MNNSINKNKYKNDGWGLSKLAFNHLELILKDIYKKNNNVKILEFGSGVSTNFFVDMIVENKWSKISSITSFDDSDEYMYKNKNNYQFLNLKKRNLLECDDINYEKMFLDKKYNIDCMKNKITPLHTRQKNCFYDISKHDLNEKYNLIIIDGPHGNGRNISYLHFREFIDDICYVLIDDITHYDFEEKFLKIFKAELIVKNIMPKISKLQKFLLKFSNNKRNEFSPWNRGGDFAIYKIISVK